ncbi:MAG: hypothetical protein L3J39_07630 [Verrucomicrobiales bacterium]|nr:hypothetical protein [Verrucomicrobiales bacterium]
MKSEFKIILVLLGLLFVMEVGVRVFETSLSKDLAQLRKLSDTAERLKVGDFYKVLIVGNSLARYGIDREILAKELERNGYGKVQVEAFHPDATGVMEWNFGLRRYFLNREVIPDRVILVTGKTHLFDSRPVPERLGAFYVDRSDIKEAVKLDLKSVENVVRFFLARFSSLFTNRVRIQPYVFYNYLPKYTQTVQEMHDQRKKQVGTSASDTRWGTTNLSRLLNSAHLKGIAVSIVGIPMRAPYDLPRPIIEEMGGHGVPLLDLSRIEGINESNFFDNYHLDEEGARRVTLELAQELVSLDRKEKQRVF